MESTTFTTTLVKHKGWQPKKKEPKKLVLFSVIARLLFWITFKKVPKKQNGRCVTCKANEICHKIKVCKCSDEQQYDLRLNGL